MLHDRQQAQKNSHGLQVVRAVYKIIESRNEVRQASSLSVSLARASWAAPDRSSTPLWARQRRSWAGGESTVWTEGRQSRSGSDQWEDQITRGGSVR